MSDGTIREVFLKGNANAEYIASTFTDVLRDLMRATAAKRDPIDGIIRATEKWNLLLDLLAHYKEPLSWAKLFEEAVLKLRHDPSDHDNISRAIQEVARAGMSLYVERTCGDGFGSARASKKETQLLDSIQALEVRRRPQR